MKFPFDFSIAFIFRLAVPGSILAIATMPLIVGLARSFGTEPAFAATFSVAAIGLGWLVVLLDQPIYMLLEGRRWWPQPLRDFGMRQQQRRLDKIVRLAAAPPPLNPAPTPGSAEDQAMKQKERQTIEWNLKQRDYAIDRDSGKPIVLYPTRLGNLLSASEGYPSRIYGADGVFYWYRLWLLMDKDLRAEVDQTQSIADSGVYVSFCVAVAAVLSLIYGVIAIPRPFSFFPEIVLPYVAGHPSLIGLAVLLAGLSYAVYRLDLHAQRQYGELFMALYDHFLPKLEFIDAVSAITTARGGIALATDLEKRRATSLYLRWYRVRPAAGQPTIPPT
jgi:hypothetical protein